MFKKILSEIPGFRTGLLWKKIIAIILYPTIFFFIIGMLAEDQNYTETSRDSTVGMFENIATILLIVVIPFILLTNLGQMRSKLPLFKSEKPLIKATAWILSCFLILVCFGFAHSALESLHTPEYIAKLNVERAKQAEEKAKQEAEAMVKKEAEEKAALLAKQEEEKRVKEEVIKKTEELKRVEEERKKQEATLLAKQEQEKKKAEENKRQEVAAKKAEEQKRLKESAQNYEKGVQALEHGDPEEALKLLKLVNESDPNYDNAQKEIVLAETDLFTQQCVAYEYRVLKKNADNYKGEKVVFSGKITHIQELNNKTLIVLSSTDKGYNLWTDDVAITYDGSLNVYENDLISVYGEMMGKYSTNVQSIINWLNVKELKIQYSRGTDVDAMPTLKARYIFKS